MVANLTYAAFSATGATAAEFGTSTCNSNRNYAAVREKTRLPVVVANFTYAAFGAHWRRRGEIRH